MKNTFIFLGIITLLILSCSSDDNNSSPTNNLPPSEVTLISPNNEATSVDKIVTFTYNVADGDPDGDTIVYDIYLNNGINETKIAEDYNETSLTYENPLGLNRNYTWRVVAKDGQGGQTESETFNFTTRRANYEIIEADYSPRLSHSTVLHNNNFVITGGTNFAGEILNSVSSNDGMTWTPIAELPDHKQNHTSSVFYNKLWVFGGDSANPEANINSIFNISDIADESWDLITNNPSFPPLRNHSQVVLNDKLYILGGLLEDDTLNQDIWRSPNGENWQLQNLETQFDVRHSHTSVVFDNKIWVIGGFGLDSFKNDVWYSENATDWTLATSNAQFSPRMLHSSVIYDNKIWVLGGNGNTGTLGDLWYSEDGINWYEAEFNEGIGGPIPQGISSTNLVVKDNAMYAICGVDHTSNLINFVLKIN